MPRNAKSFVIDKVVFPGPAGAIVVMRGWEEATRDVVMGIKHACPCGCGQWGFIAFEADGFKDYWSPQPKAGDDMAKLTLSPSIGFMKDRVTGQYHWHGYLRDGVFEEC